MKPQKLAGFPSALEQCFAFFSLLLNPSSFVCFCVQLLLLVRCIPSSAHGETVSEALPSRADLMLPQGQSPSAISTASVLQHKPFASPRRLGDSGDRKKDAQIAARTRAWARQPPSSVIPCMDPSSHSYSQGVPSSGACGRCRTRGSAYTQAMHPRRRINMPSELNCTRLARPRRPDPPCHSLPERRHDVFDLKCGQTGTKKDGFQLALPPSVFTSVLCTATPLICCKDPTMSASCKLALLLRLMGRVPTQLLQPRPQGQLRKWCHTLKVGKTGKTETEALLPLVSLVCRISKPST